MSLPIYRKEDRITFKNKHGKEFVGTIISLSPRAVEMEVITDEEERHCIFVWNSSVKKATQEDEDRIRLQQAAELKSKRGKK